MKADYFHLSKPFSSISALNDGECRDFYVYVVYHIGQETNTNKIKCFRRLTYDLKTRTSTPDYVWM